MTELLRTLCPEIEPFMTKFHVKNLCVETDGKTVVGGASFVLKSGEIHVLMGPNGSGKSSLLNAIMGHPKYVITKGDITLDDNNITNLPTEKKAQAGIFLSLQHLPEIAGVTLTNFLHKAYCAQKGDNTPPLDFYKRMEARAKEFGIDHSFLRKHLNAGLSGGEKKQSEVLQLLALEPKFALLDEIDSGVDVDAQKHVFSAIEHLRKNGVGFLLVSHHPNLLQHIKPNQVSIMKNGKVVATGGKELVEKISKEGFDAIP
ncbi:MAG: Fe-S cluster assembly ATPase SufC [Patescibacteria group bacterium]